MTQVVPLFVLSHCNAGPRPLSYRGRIERRLASPPQWTRSYRGLSSAESRGPSYCGEVAREPAHRELSAQSASRGHFRGDVNLAFHWTSADLNQ